MKEAMEKLFEGVEVIGGITFSSPKYARYAYSRVYALKKGDPVDIPLDRDHKEFLYTTFIGWLNLQEIVYSDKDSKEEILSKVMSGLEAMANIDEAVVEVYLEENDCNPTLARVSVAMMLAAVADPSTFRYLSIAEAVEKIKKFVVQKTQNLMADFFDQLRNDKEDLQ